VIYAVIAFGFAVAGGLVGRHKGSSFIVWFLISGAVPVIGLAAAILYRTERDELRRQCPSCGRLIKLYDQMCMSCGHDLDFPDSAVESELDAGRQRPAPAT
jgi:hypothetical protein